MSPLPHGGGTESWAGSSVENQLIYGQKKIFPLEEKQDIQQNNVVKYEASVPLVGKM